MPKEDQWLTEPRFHCIQTRVLPLYRSLFLYHIALKSTWKYIIVLNIEEGVSLEGRGSAFFFNSTSSTKSKFSNLNTTQVRGLQLDGKVYAFLVSHRVQYIVRTKYKNRLDIEYDILSYLVNKSTNTCRWNMYIYVYKTVKLLGYGFKMCCCFK